MNPESWQRIREVFDDVVEKTAVEREATLVALTGRDSLLLAEVRSLLRAHDTAGTGFLSGAGMALDGREMAAPADSSLAGTRVGAYQIGVQIGRGGMGEVYRASRVDGQYTQTVAVKFVRAGFATRLVLERLRQERQILAGLEHPNIARLLDGGTTEEGIPYLVMEYVDGLPIDQHCTVHALSLESRLELFQRVCAAVSYAHRHLVVHRDIKASNIVVAADGTPKLLDFGIAKIVDPVGAPDGTQLRPFTPEYASPEQIRGDAVTTAADVYSLGVLLFRLLTSRSPYPAEATTPHALARAICEAEPLRPSVVVVSTTEMGKGVARRLRGDIDAITLKALRKEPLRRYASVEQMASDIQRHLSGLSVEASKGSWRYHAGKFLRRHKVVSTAVAVVLLALLTGVEVALHEAHIALQNQRRAEQRFNDVRGLANSLMFEIQDSMDGLPGATNTRKLIMQRAGEYLDTLARESGDNLSLRRELAAAYEKLGIVQDDNYGSSLGDNAGALQNLGKALTIRQQIASGSERTVADLAALATVYDKLGSLQWYSGGGTRAGLRSLGLAVDTAELALRLEPRNASAVQALANAYQHLGDVEGGSGLHGGVGELHAAEENHRRAVALLQNLVELRPREPEPVSLLARATLSVGDDQVRAGETTQAMKEYLLAEELIQPIATKYNNAVYRRGLAVSHTRIGDTLLMTGHADEALAHYRMEQDILRPLAAADPHDMPVQAILVLAEGDVGHALVEGGRVAEGRATLSRAMTDSAAFAKTFGYVNSRELLASTAGLLGEALERSGDLTGARRYYGQALEMYRATSSSDLDDIEDAVNAIIMRNHLAVTLMRLSLPQALAQYRTALATEDALAADTTSNVEVLYALADTLSGMGDVAAASAENSSDPKDRLRSWMEARNWYLKSRRAWQRIAVPGPVSPSMFHAGDARSLQRRVAVCDAHISRLRAVRTPARGSRSDAGTMVLR